MTTWSDFLAKLKGDWPRLPTIRSTKNYLRNYAAHPLLTSGFLLPLSPPRHCMDECSIDAPHYINAKVTHPHVRRGKGGQPKEEHTEDKINAVC